MLSKFIDAWGRVFRVRPWPWLGHALCAPGAPVLRGWLTDLCRYHGDVVPQQRFSVKELRRKDGAISRINVEYPVQVRVSIDGIPEKAA